MTESFNITLVDEFFAALRALIEKWGGPKEFFVNLGKSVIDITYSFADRDQTLRTTLLHALENRDYRASLLSRLPNKEEEQFFEEWFSTWDIWQDLYPEDARWVGIILLGPMSEMLSGPIPKRANGVAHCFSHIYLDAFSEEFFVKSGIKLLNPNKELGGSNAWVISSSLNAYLLSLNTMLGSLVLRESESKLFKLPMAETVVGGILATITQISETLKKLSAQFEEMKKP